MTLIIKHVTLWKLGVAAGGGCSMSRSCVKNLWILKKHAVNTHTKKMNFFESMVDEMYEWETAGSPAPHRLAQIRAVLGYWQDLYDECSEVVKTSRNYKKDFSRLIWPWCDKSKKRRLTVTNKTTRVMFSVQVKSIERCDYESAKKSLRKNKTSAALCKRWVFLQGSSSPVCPVVVLRTHGGECLPSAMSDSEHWASPWITARPKRRRSA